MSAVRRRENRTMHNRLHALRTAHALSRVQLAERVGVNVQTVGALERGEYYPSLYVALLIAETLQTSVHEIFAWQPWPPPAPEEG